MEKTGSGLDLRTLSPNDDKRDPKVTVL